MRPVLFGINKFNLVIVPRHDRPLKRKKVLAIEGALNLIDDKYLEEAAEELIKSHGLNKKSLYLGLLIGGESKRFHLSNELILDLIKEVKTLAEDLGAEILLTTSRRTALELEKLIKREFKDYPQIKLMIIANEKNIPQAIGGILGLSKIIITSPESISMVSEAVSSKKYVFVFNAPDLSPKHKHFLDHFVKNKYIYLIKRGDLSKIVKSVWRDKPAIYCPKDNYLVTDALRKIL
jgi:mitochondrial fission protein ELM1